MKNIHEFGELNDMLERANYTCLAEEELTILLSKSNSLFGVELNVNFDDFESYAVYYRGNTSKTINKPTIFGLHYAKAVDAWERVVLLIKFKDESYFLGKFNGNHNKLESLNFTPGKIYNYMYTNVAPAELGILFPNITICMLKKDKLILSIPIVGAVIPVITKLFSQLPVIWLAIQSLINDQKIDNLLNVFPAIMINLILLLLLCGFIFRQYIKFKNKKIKMLQHLSMNLFFKNSGSISNLEFKMNIKALSILGLSIFGIISIISKMISELPLLFSDIEKFIKGETVSDPEMLMLIIFYSILLLIVTFISFIQYIRLKNSKIKSLKDYIDYFFFKNVEAEPRELQSLINS